MVQISLPWTYMADIIKVLRISYTKILPADLPPMMFLLSLMMHKWQQPWFRIPFCTRLPPFELASDNQCAKCGIAPILIKNVLFIPSCNHTKEKECDKQSDVLDNELSHTIVKMIAKQKGDSDHHYNTSFLIMLLLLT